MSDHDKESVKRVRALPTELQSSCEALAGLEPATTKLNVVPPAFMVRPSKRFFPTKRRDKDLQDMAEAGCPAGDSNPWRSFVVLHAFASNLKFLSVVNIRR